MGHDQDREILRRLLRQGQVGSIDQAVAYNSVVVLGIFDHISQAHRRIDDALSDLLIGRRPVYIGVPMVYANCLVEGKRLQRPVFNAVPRNDPRKEEHVVEVILRYLDAAKDPVIIVDGGVIRQGIQDIAQEFVGEVKIAHFCYARKQACYRRLASKSRGFVCGITICHGPQGKSRGFRSRCPYWSLEIAHQHHALLALSRVPQQDRISPR